MLASVTDLFERAPTLSMGVLAFILMAIAGFVGSRLRQRPPREVTGDEETQEGYIVSGVVGLLALLMGFTFSLAVDRFDARRLLVLDEANAIGTTYLRTQLLEEPHRARISGLLVAYTDNRIALATTKSQAQAQQLLAVNDRLLTDLWAATSSAFLTIKGLDFSSTYVEGMNNLIDLDSARKAARAARVPTEVFAVLIGYMTVTAGVLGYVLIGRQVRGSATFMFLLLTVSLMLVADINDPTRGGVTEGQGPMERLRRSLQAQPPPVFDKFRIEDARPPETKP